MVTTRGVLQNGGNVRGGYLNSGRPVCHIQEKRTAIAGGRGIDFGGSGSTPATTFSSAPSSRSHYITAFEFGVVFRSSSLYRTAVMIFLYVLLAGIGSIACGPTVYDQRQTGKTNVRLEVKDAVIIAVGDGELGGDYDYNYDYSDLTIKPGHPSLTTSAAAAPHKPTTPKTTMAPSTSTTNFNLTQNAALVLEAENNSIIFPGIKPGNESSEPIKIIASNPYKPDQIPVVVLQEVHRPNKFLPVKTVEKQYVPSSRIRPKASDSSAVDTEEHPPRHCSPGFFLDNHNRCKRIRRPTRERPQLPIGLRYDHRPLIRT